MSGEGLVRPEDAGRVRCCTTVRPSLWRTTVLTYLHARVLLDAATSFLPSLLTYLLSLPCYLATLLPYYLTTLLPYYLTTVRTCMHEYSLTLVTSLTEISDPLTKALLSWWG